MTFKLKLLLFCVTAFVLNSCNTAVKNNKTLAENLNHFPLDSLLTKDQVGAAYLPDKIAPVDAPFDMPEFKKPVFPDLRVSIVDRGAVEDTKVTQVIQSLIDSVSDQGGGMVVIPKGKWKSGRISLKSNVNLHLESGAELYFSGELEDYRPAVFTRHEGVEVMSLGACIYAYKQDNIAVTGSGTIYGPDKGSVRAQMMTEDVTEKFVPIDKPVSERVYEGYNGSSIFLPMMISPTSCTNVYIEGVTLERTAFWNIVPVYCDGVIIRGVTVNSVGIPRGDGIDIESSRNVLIEYSTLNNGDDCFTMKAGRGEDGLRVNKPTENVVIRYCLAKQGHGAVTVGSETAGMVRNMYIHDCVFDNTGVGVRFKTRRPRGGGGENLYYKRLRMNLHGTAFKWDMLGQPMYVGELAERMPPRPVNPLTPQFKNIFMEDILVEKAETFIKAYGIPESPVENVKMEHVRVLESEKLLTLNDAMGMDFKHIRVRSSDSVMNFLDARNIKFNDAVFYVPGDTLIINKKGDLTKTIEFKNSPNAIRQD